MTTHDAAVWAQTHTKTGELSAEGFRRGMTEHCQVGRIRLRLWLYDMRPPATWGLALVKTYAVGLNDSGKPFGSMPIVVRVERFSTLAAARAQYAVLRAEAQALADAAPATAPVYW